MQVVEYQFQLPPCKVIINPTHAHYRLSNNAKFLIRQKKAAHPEMTKTTQSINDYRSDPTDSCVIEAIEELGSKALAYSELHICTIPGMFTQCYDIKEYDGAEWIDCNPKDLVALVLSKIDPASLSPEECKRVMIRLKEIIETQYDVVNVQEFSA